MKTPRTLLSCLLLGSCTLAGLPLSAQIEPPSGPAPVTRPAPADRPAPPPPPPGPAPFAAPVPAPAPAPVSLGAPKTMSGTISQLNYNPEGDIEGFVVNGSMLVHLPPPMLRAAEGLHKGDGIEVQGLEHSSGAGLSVLEAQSIQDRTSNKKLALPSPGGPAPYASSGKVQQLNYGPDGAINGFLLDNGTLATMPPFSASQPSAVRVGSSVSVAGTARATMSGRTVVDVQTITVNGQSIAFNRPIAPPRPPAAPALRP
jgi:hypothetical protein